MGWCGWTEAETLATRIPAIELAADGVAERLMFAATGKMPDKKRNAPVSAAQVLDIFRQAAG